MQKLFTGKIRLAPYCEKVNEFKQTDIGLIPTDWKVSLVSELMLVKKGQLITKENSRKGTIPVIAGGKKPSYYHDKANRFGKTIAISASGANAGYVSFYSSPIFASDCSTISEDEKYSIEFIYLLLLFMQDQIYHSQVGGAQPHINPKDLNPMIISYPEKDEQEKIAKVIFDMDLEILALKKRLDKTKQVKVGMMQQLFNGRVRLI